MPPPVSTPRKPVVVETILSPDLEWEKQQRIAAEEKEAAQRYDLGYGYMGNGLTVWNRLEEELSSPVIKCKKRPRKKCSFVAEEKGKR